MYLLLLLLFSCGYFCRCCWSSVSKGPKANRTAMRDLFWNLLYIRLHRFVSLTFLPIFFSLLNGFIRKKSDAIVISPFLLLFRLDAHQFSNHGNVILTNRLPIVFMRKYGVFSVRDTNYQRWPDKINRFVLIDFCCWFFLFGFSFLAPRL